jgi:elongator complex protein 1
MTSHVCTAAENMTDGERLVARILMTPFRTQNIPPPMSSYIIEVPSTPVHVAFSPVKDVMAVLLPEGRCQVWNLRSATKKLKGPRGSAKAADPVLVSTIRLFPSEEDVEPRQICIDIEGRIVALGSNATSGDCLMDRSGDIKKDMISDAIGRLALDGAGKVIAVTQNGSILSIGEFPPLPV